MPDWIEIQLIFDYRCDEKNGIKMAGNEKAMQADWVFAQLLTNILDIYSYHTVRTIKVVPLISKQKAKILNNWLGVWNPEFASNIIIIIFNRETRLLKSDGVRRRNKWFSVGHHSNYGLSECWSSAVACGRKCWQKAWRFWPFFQRKWGIITKHELCYKIFFRNIFFNHNLPDIFTKITKSSICVIKY